MRGVDDVPPVVEAKHGSKVGAKGNSRADSVDHAVSSLASRADFGPIQYGEPMKLCVQSPANPLADLVKGLPDGTFVTITVELKTPVKA